MQQLSTAGPAAGTMQGQLTINSVWTTVSSKDPVEEAPDCGTGGESNGCQRGWLGAGGTGLFQSRAEVLGPLCYPEEEVQLS